MQHGAREVRARRASDAPVRQRALKLLELYRSLPEEMQSQPHMRVLMARLEGVVGDGPVLQLAKALPPPAAGERRGRDLDATG